MRTGLLVHFLLLFAFTSAFAQTSGSEIVPAIETAYRQLQYQEAERLGAEVLANYGAYSARELTDVHTILALIAYSRSELTEARRHFLSALQLTPDLQLDPALVPPKINEYFEELKAGAGEGVEEFFPEIRYVLVRDHRTGAALRSMLLPGWGQFYKGQKLKGTVIAGLFGAAIGGLVISQIKQDSAMERYIQAIPNEPPGELASLNNTYEGWRDARNAFALGAGVVWLAGYVDALVTGGPHFESRRIALETAPAHISLRIRF